MDEQRLRAAFNRERIVFPGDPTPVVQIEMVDRDPVSAQLLWLEGRGFDFRAIAEGNPEPRNPGPDNPLSWPLGYVEQLARELRRSAPRARVLEGTKVRNVPIAAQNAMLIEADDKATVAEIRRAFGRALRVLRAQQVRHGGRAGKRKQPSHFRLQRAVFFMWRRGTGRPGQRKTWNGIADEWQMLTADWWDSLCSKPNEWPDSLEGVPQALAAYEEWRELSKPDVENLTEGVVRETVLETIRPLVNAGG